MGVAVLLVVMSVMNGFENELRSRILKVTSHATLEGLEGSLTEWREAQQRAGAMPGVTAAVPYVAARAMLAAGETPRRRGTARHRSGAGAQPRRLRQRGHPKARSMIWSRVAIA